VKASQRLDEIKAELSQISQDLPGVLKALGPALPIAEIVALKRLCDNVHDAALDAYSKKFPPTPRIETRGQYKQPKQFVKIDARSRGARQNDL
jgi:hypothetical protein